VIKSGTALYYSLSIFCGRVHRRLRGRTTVNVVLAVDLIENQHKSHGKSRVKPSLHTKREHFPTKHNAGGGVHLPSNLSHRFLRHVEDRAASLREAPFDLVLLTGAIVHLHRQTRTRPSNDRRSLHAEDRFITVHSLPLEALPPLMQTRPLQRQKHDTQLTESTPLKSNHPTTIILNTTIHKFTNEII